MDMSTLPKFTDEGFKKIQLPAGLHKAVASYFNERYLIAEPELSDAIGTFISSEHTSVPARMVELDSHMRSVIREAMLPVLEQWVQRKLELTAIYGIREYCQGATLQMHTDKIETHHVSAIVNVYQYVNSDWPLHIRDHEDRLHEVYMQPGEAILYESARLMHGRVFPLDGLSYANFFIHTKEIQ